MRTTLDIDEKLVEDAVRLTGEKNKSRAVSKALEDYLYWRAVQGLRAMAGNVDFAEDLEPLAEEQARRDHERLDRAMLNK